MSVGEKHMGVAHMRDFSHNYDYLRRHALRGVCISTWQDRLTEFLWCVVWTELAALLILQGHILG